LIIAYERTPVQFGIRTPRRPPGERIREETLLELPFGRLTDLHGDLADPPLDGMTALNEATARYSQRDSFSPGRPHDSTSR
jgi:hypothetical protein